MKFKPRITSHSAGRLTAESRVTGKAFTLIELVVTVALLTMVISFTSVIFNVSIDAHRTSAASAEIMQKFRAITDQLNRDFKGLQKDAPLLIWFQKDNAPLNPNRFDQIMFFAAGDFQSTQLYYFSGLLGTAEPDPVSGTSPLVGNVARIHYGQAQRPNYDKVPSVIEQPWQIEKENDRLLARRRHILSADTRLVQWPDAADMDISFPADYSLRIGYKKNEVYEHDSLSLAQWKTIIIEDYDPEVLRVFPDFPPWVDKGDPNTFHKLMCEGIGSFAIQWAYPYPVSAPSEFRWYPETQHFALMGGSDKFGVCFNIPDPTSTGVLPPWYFIQNTLYESGTFDGFYPRALKFTFTLYDSKGIIKNGREFTHIVYLED